MLKSKTTLIVASLVAITGCATPGAGPELIINGGPILTMEGAAPTYVEAVAVDKGRIVYAGSLAEAMKLKGTATRIKDLGGQTMLPGFIDGHTHFAQLGAQAVGANLLPSPDGKADTIDALVAELQVFAKSPDVAQTGWIFGMGYDDSVLGRHPTKADLDRVSTTVPVAAPRTSITGTSIRSTSSQSVTKSDGISAFSAIPGCW